MPSPHFTLRNHHHSKYERRNCVSFITNKCSRCSKCSMLKLLVLLLVGTFCVHRFYARYEGHRRFVHTPIHTLPRVCPEPTYTTLSRRETPKICLTTLTDEQQNSWLQRWIRWRDFDGLLAMTWKNKLDYANKYGYFLFDESAHLDTSRPPSWSKIKAARRLLMDENCTWVWWLDADTVIMNSEKRVEEFLPASNAPQDLLLSQDHSGNYNAGGWLIRNSPFALEFLEEWWNKKEFVKPHGFAKSGDNDAFKDMLAVLPEFDQHILVPPLCTFNSFAYFTREERLEKILSQPEGSEGSLTKQIWYQNEAFYHKGDLLAHVAGYNNKEQPVSMLLELAE